MALKLRKRSLFPADVTAQSPIVLTKTGAQYDFSLDEAALEASLVPHITSITPTGATVARNIADWMAADPFIEDFGGGIAVADNTAAFNAAVAAGAGVRFRDTVDKGTYHFTTAPNPIAKSFRISGANDGMDGMSWISRDYAEGTPTRGLFSWTTGQPYIKGLFIISGTGGSGGAAVSIIPDVAATGGPGSLDHVRISTSGGTWSYSIYVDGSNLTAPIGVRTLYFNDVTAFGASTRSVYLKSVVHLNWNGGSVSQSGGVNGGLEITGTASAPSSENVINIDSITDNLVLDRLSNSIVNIGELGASITNTANVSGIIGSGKIVGSAPQNNWTGSSWRDGGNIWISASGSLTWNAGTQSIAESGGVINFTVPSGAGFSNSVFPLTTNVGAVGTSSFGWSALFLAGSSSGIGRLNAPAVASSYVWTMPAATATIIGKDTTDILTNKTLDSAGTGNVLKVSGVTVSAGQYPGTTTNDSATAGNVGEYVESVVASGSAVALTTATAKTVTSISLTAGDWDVDAIGYILPAATTSMTNNAVSISGTTNTLDTTTGKVNGLTYAAVVTGGAAQSMVIPPYRLSLSGTTTVYLVVQATFTVSTAGGYGIIRARRVR